MLIIANKRSIDSKLYILTEIIFKSSLAIFMQYYLVYHDLKEIEFEDKIIISFAGGLLFYDAWVNDFTRLLKVYKINNYGDLLQKIKGL
jgi:hypothetical protein